MLAPRAKKLEHVRAPAAGSILSTVSARSAETSPELAVMPSQFVRPISPLDSLAFIFVGVRQQQVRLSIRSALRGRVDDGGLWARRGAEALPTKEPTTRTIAGMRPHQTWGMGMSFAATEKPATDPPAAIARDEEFARARSREIPVDRRAVPDAGHAAVYARISSVIGRIGLQSTNEIDRLVLELQSLQQFLEAESQRVQREISAYMHLTQAAAKSSSIVIESMGHWRNGADRHPRRPE